MRLWRSNARGAHGAQAAKAVSGASERAWRRGNLKIPPTRSTQRPETSPVKRNIAEVACGDLSQITVDVKGEILELKNTNNTMVDQLNAFAGEVTRVAREVGTEGKLGGQAEVPGVGGTWKDLTDNVNFMASNLDRPGPQHRRFRNRYRRGPFAKNYCGRARRNSSAQRNPQHHGRAVAIVRR